MNHQTAIQRPEGLTKFINTTFEIPRSKKSQWVREGTGVDPNTGMDTGIPAQKMSHGKFTMLPMRSRLYLGKNLGFMPTRYIIGANTIYENEYYEDENGELVLERVTIAEAKDKGYHLRPGLKSLYSTEDLKEEYRRAASLNICFDTGILELRKYSEDPMLLKFVNEHELNKMAPRAEDNRDPLAIRLFQFQPLIREAKAKKAPIVETWDASVEAILFADKLRTKTGNGYSYNENKMDAILSILGIGIGIAAGDVTDKFKAIIQAAKADGTSFMKIIDEVMNAYRTEIGKAETLEVLSYVGNEAKMVVDGKKTTFHTFAPDTPKKDLVDELVLHFLGSHIGKSNYQELKRNTSTALLKSVAKK